MKRGGRDVRRHGDRAPGEAVQVARVVGRARSVSTPDSACIGGGCASECMLCCAVHWRSVGHWNRAEVLVRF